MAVIPLYRALVHLLASTPPGTPLWPRFAAEVQAQFEPFFAGLFETYGPDAFGAEGLPGILIQTEPMLRNSLLAAPSFAMEVRAEELLTRVVPLLPIQPPPLYLGTLFFLAPAATLCIEGQPAITLGMERFHPNPPPHEPKFWYHPQEAEEMIPHEAAHCARMQLLSLPLTPRRLTLLEMAMLEGTALTFTDQLLGRETLTTFMPPVQLGWHRTHDALVRQAVAAESELTGMEVFKRYFGPGAPISGYYAGYSWCREYLDRYGSERMLHLLGLPSREILRQLH